MEKIGKFRPEKLKLINILFVYGVSILTEYTITFLLLFFFLVWSENYEKQFQMTCKNCIQSKLYQAVTHGEWQDDNKE